MKKWDSLVEAYVKRFNTRGVSENYQKAIHSELSRFGIWLKKRKPKPKVEEITGELIIKYISSRTAFHSKMTVCGVISKLKGMGRFLYSEGYWSSNPLKWIQGPKLDHRSKLPRSINKGHLKKLWIEATNIKDKYLQELWLLILSILYSTGLRRGELVRLTVKSWNREEGYLKIDGRKNGIERHIPLPDFTRRCLENYLPKRANLLLKNNSANEDALLINSRGRPMKAERIGIQIHKLSKKAGIPLITMHQFRHTCASDLLEEGITLPTVQGFLGHAAIASTYRYVYITDPEKEKAMALHPINNTLSKGVE